MDKPKQLTYGDLIDMLDKRKAYKNKYRIKVSYRETDPNKQYRENLEDAMRKR